MNPSLTLMLFQETGSDWLARSRTALLCYEMGTGKTPTAIRAAVKAGAKRILVVCPPIATAVWRDHFRDWSDYPVKVFGPADAARPYAFMQGSGVRIVAYSRLTVEAVPRAAARAGWDVVILDEIHYVKSPNAKRTRAVYGDKLDLVGSPLEGARHVWGLTGTPVLNHPAEFWTHLKALRPETILAQGQEPMTEAQFTERFCVTKPTPWGVRILGGRNTAELAARIKPFIDRKRAKDVLSDLPALRITEHSLPADTYMPPSLRQELADAMKQFVQDPGALDDDELLETVQAGGVAFSTVRRLIGRAKAEGVAALVADMLDDDEDGKVILFAHHREVILDLADALKRFSPLVITGATAMNVRESSIALFQNDPRLRLIILAIEAAGEVITLTAARNVVIAEPSPVPAKNRQAIARAHRKGQVNPVTARFVLLPGTLDARLMSIVARKTKEIAELLDTPVPV